MKRSLRTLRLLVLLIMLSPAQAQQQTVSGVVSDPLGRPVEGARVEMVSPYADADTTDAEGAYVLSGVTTPAEDTVPEFTSFEVVAGYPNPFADAARSCVSAPEAGRLETTVYDAAGRRVFRSARAVTPGVRCVAFDASGWSSGAYLVEHRLGDERRTQVLTRVRTAPVGAGVPALGDGPSAEASASGRGGCDEIENTIRVARAGFEPFEVTVCLPPVATYDPQLAFAQNTQAFTIRSTIGGLVEGATVLVDVDGDQTPDFQGTSDASGEAQVTGAYYGPATVLVESPGHEPVVQAITFGGAGAVTVTLPNLRFVSTVRVVDHLDDPAPEAEVAATCEIDGLSQVATDVTDVQGNATVAFEVPLARGGEYDLGCTLTVSKPSYIDTELTTRLTDEGTFTVGLNSLPRYNWTVLDALDHHVSVQGGHVTVTGQVYDGDRNIISNGRVPIDNDGRVSFYSDDSFDVNLDHPVYGGAKILWLGGVGPIPDSGDSRVGWSWFAGDDLSISSYPGVALDQEVESVLYTTSKVWNAENMNLYIRVKTNRDPLDDDDWLSRPHGNPTDFYNGVLRYAPIVGPNPPLTSLPSEAQMAIVGDALRWQGDFLESRTHASYTVERLPNSQHGSHNLGVFDGPTTPPGTFFAQWDSSTGDVINFEYYAPEDFLVFLKGTLDENIQSVLPYDQGAIYVGGSADEPFLLDPYGDFVTLSYTAGNGPRMGYND